MNVALIGPTGVLGRALVPLLLQQGHGVRAVARSAAKARALFPQVAEISEYDLLSSSADDLPALLVGCDVVMHIATSIPRDYTAPNAWEANTRLRTDGVRRLLAACLQAGVRRYIQQSITMAYPDHGDAWITENMPLDTSPEHGQTGSTVATMEQLVREIPPEKMAWCILRGGNFVGKDTAQERVIERLRAGQEKVACDGRNFVSLVHVLDVASAFAAAVEHAPAGSTFNVADEPIRQGEYLDRLAASIGAAGPARDLTAKCPPSWRCSSQAAQAALRWRPTHGLFPQEKRGDNHHA